MLASGWTDAALDLFLGSTCAGCARPGRALCVECAVGLPRGGRAAPPTPAPPGLAPVVAAGSYDGPLRGLVIAHKERSRFALARPLGRVLAGAVVATACEGTRPVVLVPVPSVAAVVRGRGHDPVLRMTRQAAGALRREGRQVAVRRLLVPARVVADQAGLGAEERGRNLQGAYRARPGAAASALGRPVIVVDDVVTTGATAREAQRALEQAGLPVLAIVVVAATQRKAHTGSLPDVRIRD